MILRKPVNGIRRSPFSETNFEHNNRLHRFGILLASLKSTSISLKATLLTTVVKNSPPLEVVGRISWHFKDLNKEEKVAPFVGAQSYPKYMAVGRSCSSVFMHEHSEE